jgi:hypothetical protein
VALLLLPALGQAAVDLPNGGRVEKVDFERHVMGLFGRSGCASGSCHGSFQGKGGFRLSLFGYDPGKDYLTITREAMGRRIDCANPENSLLLLKATGAVEHGGTRRFSPGSWQYQIIREWIAAGAPWTKGSGEVTSIRVSPAELAVAKPGETGQLTIKAQFADGRTEDITPFCEFRTNDDSVAEVNTIGQVKSLRAGDTAIIVSYRGNVLPVRVMVPTATEAGFRYPDVAEVNFVDREVFAKLRRLNIVPSDLCGDADFLRRVTIDTIGSLPSPDEVRQFLDDKDPKKREKLVDKLLAHPLHAALWATKLSDITGNNTQALENQGNQRNKRSQMWHDWLRKRIADNVPYDEIVHGILCATTRDGQTPEEWLENEKKIEEATTGGWDTRAYAERKSLDLFWRRQQAVTVDQWGEKTAAAFMGVRLECAQCHKHPFDRWTQIDYRAFANVYTAVALGVSPEAKKVIDDENNERKKNVKEKQQPILLREVFIGTSVPGKGNGSGAALPHPETGRPLPPKCPGGPAVKMQGDPREQVFDWLRSPDNPWFARSFVNRVWGHYFGIGIVQPVDDFSLANPPSNPKLLDALAKDFLDHKFDIRHIERTILLSRTYQLSSATNATNRLDRNNYSHSFVRPMMAEVVVDVLNSALGTTEDFGKDVAPPNAHAVEVGSTLVQNNLAYAFRIFGRPPRTTACDCERAMEPALPQKLYFMVDQTVQNKLKAPTGRLQKLLADKTRTDDQVLDELFLATLTRLPTDHDRKVFTEYHGRIKDREKAFTDTLWALINTREFALNH